MGYTVDQSLDLAKVATMFQNIADTEISAGDAAAFINSQLKAFRGEFSKVGDEGQQAMAVIDAVNEVSNRFGVGSNDLQLALSKTSSAMAGYGNSFSETLGIITAGTEVMVGQPSKVARGWRTIGANILKLAKNQDTWTDSNNKVTLSLKDNQGQIRSTFDILKELDGQWDSLSETEKNSIALDLAGKNQMEVFKATMDNFSSAIGANEAALESQGSAEEENAKRMESLQGHLSKLKSAFTEFANTLISSDFLKGIIDIGTTLLKAASTGFGQFVVKAGLVIAAITPMIKGFKKLNSALKGLKFLKKLKVLWEGTAAGAAEDAAATEADTKAKERNTAATERNTVAQQRNAKARGKATGASVAETAADTASTSTVVTGGKKSKKGIKPTKKLAKGAAEGMTILPTRSLKNAEKGIKTTEKLGKAAGKTAGRFKGLATSAIGALTALSTPQMLGIAAAIGMVTWAVVSTTKATNKHTKSVDKMIASNKKQEKAIEDNAKTADFYIGKIDELSKKEHRNAGEKKLLASYVDELNKLYPDLNLTYDENTDTLSKNTDEIKKNIEKLKEQQKQTQAQEAASKALKKAQAKKSKAEDLQADIQQTVSSIGKLEKGSQAWQQQINKLKKQQTEYKDAMNASSKAMIEYTRNQNKVAMASEDYQKLAEQLPESIKKGIKKGLYEAPLTQEDVDNLIPFDKAVTEFEATGRKIPNSIYAGIQDGIYNMPKSRLQVENLFAFDEAKTNLESLGIELPDSFIQGFNSSSDEMQSAYSSVFAKMGDLSAEELSAHADEIDAIMNNQNSSMQTKMMQLAEIFDMPLEFGDVDFTTVDEVQKKIDSLDGKSADITLKAKDEASGEIEEVKIAADDYASGSYVAELLGIDNASAMIEYAADVANGTFEGSYTAWLYANNTDALNKTNLTNQQLEYLANGNYTAFIKAVDKTSSGVQSAKQQLASVKDRRVTIKAVVSGVSAAAAAISKIGASVQHAKGKRKGEKGGLAWVGDEGSKSNPKPELIQTKQGAYLAGTQGWEQVYLDDGDIVYSASDTKKLLAGDKRLTDRFIRRRATGTPKFLSSDSDSDSVKKAIEAWSNQVSSWEHNVDIGRATQSQYVNWLKSQYKISNKMTEDQYRSAEKTIWDYYEAFEEAALDNYLTSLKYGKLTLDQTLNYIRQSRKAQKITQEKADELEYEAYKNHIEWNIKKFENDEATFADTKKLVLDFYNYQKKYGKMSLDDYYGYLDDLADATQEKELDRLEKLQEREENQQDLAKKYAQLQVDNIEKQIDAIDKQNEAQDKANELAELYNDLAEARSKRVRVYREGVGFVYEQDTKAIKEAQKAISDFEAENAADSLEALKKQWQDILDMFDDQDALADIKELENALGMTSKELFGDMGTNLKQWTEWYKNTVSTGMGLEDIITQLDALSGWDKITNYLNSEGKVDWNKIKQAIQNNRFASGTTNAKGGFSVVGEKGWELGLLNKGDAIFPHDISKNLMEWGKYSPNQYKFKDTTTGRVETYNFDKLVLPNVSNANEFVNELKKLPNLAIQRSGRR